MNDFKFSIKNMCIFSSFMALYVVVSNFFHIPIGIGNLWIDMGYVVYGFMMALYGVPAVLIGVIGVFLENILFTGWISYSWMAGQLVIGIVCGFVFTKYKNRVIVIAAIILSTWVGIGLVKTIIEIALGYGIFPVKIVTNSIAAALDMIPITIGYFIASSKVFKTFKG